ncbi:MAG TPA: IS66 family transposase [Tepidisphaeraceae bacterium]|jgi:hypothetical protein|nr:IS66 family transposase [Tepidisphaeraceae bacterium]
MEGLSLLQANDFLWRENTRLRQENDQLRQQIHQQDESRPLVVRLRRQCDKLAADKERLQKRVAELSRKPRTGPGDAVAVFVKPAIAARRRKTPGRKAGHAAALRRMPEAVDVHQEMPLPVDAAGKVSCPHCKTRLARVRRHKRLVEDIIPARVITTCYHTTSGYCPSCRRTIESRADHQPPACDLPHAQLGINALSTAAMMRVCYRLPLRQITQLFADLPGLALSPGAVCKQLVRLGRWLEDQYHRLKQALRAAGVVYADETSWRVDGRNACLWTLTNDTHTLYHVDKSRGRKVITGLLGETFGLENSGTLVSDFYSVYDRFDCPQQKCLAHLLRELRETSARRPELIDHPFFKRCKRLIGEMLRLRQKKDPLAPAAYEHQVRLLEKRLKQLGESIEKDPDARRIAARLRKYDTRLTTFLHKPQVNATNNHAERALRPAVVMRKIIGGNRSQSGAQAWAILASVMRTARQQGRDVLETIQTLLKAAWAGKNITLLTDLLTPAKNNTS